MPSETNSQITQQISEINPAIIVGDDKPSKVSAYQGMNMVFEKAQNVVNTMEDGEHMTTTDFIRQVAEQIDNMTASHIANLTQMFLKNISKDVTVELGRNGGVWKGKKPKLIDTRPRCPTCSRPIKTTKSTQEELSASELDQEPISEDSQELIN